MTDSIRLISYNVRVDTPNDANHAWRERAAEIVRLLRFYEPDVLVLQETLPHQLTYLVDALPELAWIAEPREPGGESTPVGFRRERLVCLESGTYWLSETPDEAGSIGWDARHPRVVTWAKLDDERTHRRVYVAGTHLDHVGARARMESAGVIHERTVRRALDEGLPLVVAGDFNFADGDPACGRLASAGLLDARSVSRIEPLGPPETFPEPGFQVTGARGAQIDLIFVSPNIDVRRFATITHHEYGIRPSDHYPVYCELEL